MKQPIAVFEVPPLAGLTGEQIDALADEIANTLGKTAESVLVEHPAQGHVQTRHGRRQPGTIAAMKSAPAQDSMTMHSKAGGGFTAERAAMHEEIIAEKLEGLPTSDQPTLYMTGGGAASGKTRALLNNEDVGIPGADKAAHIDPDGMKAELPEYQAAVAGGKPWAAAYAHEESSHMAKLGVHRALQNGNDVVYDSVGDNGIHSLEAKVQAFRDRGATRVVGEYATVDTSTAIARAQARGERTGRFVAPTEITRQHADVSTTFVAAAQRGTFDSLRLWDNNGPTPVLVASATKTSGLTVHEPSLWDSFVAKGR